MGDKSVVERAFPAIQALEQMPEGTRLLWARSASGEDPVFAGTGVLDTRWWPLQGRGVCVGDTKRGPRSMASAWEEERRAVEVEPGEDSKSLGTGAGTLIKLSEASGD